MKTSFITFAITATARLSSHAANGISIKSKTRRAVLNSIAAATSIPVCLSKEAVAAGQDNFVIPGVAGTAPFRNLIVDESTLQEDNEDGPVIQKKRWEPVLPCTKLGKSRLLATELSPLTSSLVPFATDNELYYNPFLLGSWETTATLRRKVYPYGTDYLPSSSLFDGSPRNRNEQPGDSATYEMQYISADGKMGNNEKPKVIAERAFNAFSVSAGYSQLSQINEIQWDRKKDPTRLTLVFSTLGQDMQPLGQKKAEIYITSRKSESGVDPESGGKVFCSSERLRSVTVVPGNVVVSDTETITEFHPVDGSNGNHIKAISRIAVYLTPNPNSREGLLWQDVNGKAVAFFDYELDMKRNAVDITAL